jgi:hypothetical protein
MCRSVLLTAASQLVGVCLARQPMPIGILFDFASQPESRVVDLMKSEIRDILAPAHLKLEFDRLGDWRSSQAFRKIVIVHFHGTCHTQVDADAIQLDQPGLLDLPALGTTAISGGHILPYVQVYCNEVRAFVPSMATASFSELYARALGRVVVHELYHALLSTRNHARSGVARLSQTARDLTRDKISLDSRSIYLLNELYGTDEKEGDSLESPSSVSASKVGQTTSVPIRFLEDEP